MQLFYRGVVDVPHSLVICFLDCSKRGECSNLLVAGQAFLIASSITINLTDFDQDISPVKTGISHRKNLNPNHRGGVLCGSMIHWNIHILFYLALYKN